MRAHANLKQYVSMHVSQWPGKQGADSQRADVCVYMSACVSLCVFDEWAGGARPQIRVQTNWVINESDRGAVMGPTPKLLMHADQHQQPFVLEK